MPAAIYVRVDILLFGANPQLERWRARAIYTAIERGPGPRAYRDQFERVVAQEPPGAPLANGPHRRVADALLRYDIFDSQVVQPVLARAPLEVGDDVGPHYRLLPGVHLFFAARVTARFDEQRGDRWWTGFTYRTLEGHPELGEETFSAEKDLLTGEVMVALRSWSQPGTLLAKLGRPFVRRLQLRANAGALDRMASLARGAV